MKKFPKLIIALIFFQSCSLFNDGISILIDQSFNPLNTKKVMLFLQERSLNQKESYNVCIADIKYNPHIHQVPNVFSVQAANGEMLNNENSIKLIWITNDSLQINYDQKLKILLQNNKVDSITIIYRAL